MAKNGNTTILSAAFERYSKLVFPHISSAPGVLNEVDVVVSSADESYPQLETDESYTLDIPVSGGKATITAATAYGALHGLETFSQLVQFNFTSASYVVRYAPWTVSDAPRCVPLFLPSRSCRVWEALEPVLVLRVWGGSEEGGVTHRNRPINYLV